MIEIRIHGRGGQGSVKASEVLSEAAFMDGKYTRASPFTGTEIRGASVEAYCRISDEEIKTREFIYNPDYILVLDSSLLNDSKTLEGLKNNSIIILNSSDGKKISLKIKNKVYSIDLTKIALEIIGKTFVNTPMLGAFVAVSNIVSLKSLLDVINKKFDDKNAKAAEVAYNRMKEIMK